MMEDIYIIEDIYAGEYIRQKIYMIKDIHSRG